MLKPSETVPSAGDTTETIGPGNIQMAQDIMLISKANSRRSGKSWISQR